MLKIFLLFYSLMLPINAFADDNYVPDRQIPAETRPFIERGTRLLALQHADLNGDKKDDYVLVLEKQKKKPGDPAIESGQRPLIILSRNKNGLLELAKRNDRIIYCSTCGGMMGDPFVGISAGRKTFTVEHYGGSAWRWSNSYKFNYSRIDNTWQLVEVREESFHVGDQEGGESRTYTPPKDFGKIDITDFDPDNWMKKKAK